MVKETNKTVNMIEAYLREASVMRAEEKPKPEEIELYITQLLLDKEEVGERFSVEVIPLANSYILRPRNNYAGYVIYAMPMFCKECGKLMEPAQFKSNEGILQGYMPCSHEGGLKPILI